VDCPYCHHSEVRTTDSRPTVAGEVRRRRVCKGCGEHFSTVERISAHDVKVMKRTQGEWEKFSRTKLRRGIEKAATKNGVDAADVDAIVERVVKRLRPKPEEPVTSQQIGDLVLRVLDSEKPGLLVTRIRFAMVFLGRTTRGGGFRDVRDFLRWLEVGHSFPDERPDRAPSLVVDRDGQRDVFNVGKLERSIGMASKGRGRDLEVRAIASRVATEVKRELGGQAIVTTQQIAAEVLKALKSTSPLAYLRYAAAVKRYASVDDFWLEAVALLDQSREATNADK
jgi:transcriptional repressor NrdR